MMKLQYKRNLLSTMLLSLTFLAALFTIGILAYLIIFVTANGLPHLNAEMFSLQYTSENGSFMPAIINTLIIMVLSLLIAVPTGIFAAIYLVEYAKRGSKAVKLIKATAEILSGIPSIIYGLFGSLFFVTTLRLGISLVSGALTLFIMILPFIMRTAQEALLSVPDTYREGSFGLGAGKLRTTFKIVLPAAIPGILAGVILAIGRIVGETAALIYTAGTVPDFPEDIMSSGRTLSVHMYRLSKEGLQTDKAYATAVMLLLIVLLINTLSAVVVKRFMKKKGT